MVAEWGVPGVCWDGWQCWRGWLCLKAHSGMVKKCAYVEHWYEKAFFSCFLPPRAHIFKRNLHCSSDRECSVLLAVPSGPLISLTQQSSQLINVLYQLPSPLELFQEQGLCLSGVQPVTLTDHLCSAEGSRASVVFLLSQSSILLAFSQFPLNSIIQHKVENLLLRVKSKACDECNCSWKHPSLGVPLC